MNRTIFVLLSLALVVWTSRADGPVPPAAVGGQPGVAPSLFGPDLVTGQLGADLARKDPYRKGACSVQLLAGYFPMSDWGPVGPSVDYVPLSFRAGLMLNDPDFGRLILPGACEVLFDYTYAPIVREFGSYFTGPSLILRYTHCDPAWVVHPYFQVGAGLAFTDAHRAPVWQELIGQSCEFLLRAEVGLRVMVTENLSVDIEGGLQHISNACLAARNGGINNLGVAVGLTYSFGRP